MRVTRKNLERLCANCKYRPSLIGIAILRMLGYKVTTYIISPSIYVHTKDGKHLLSAENTNWN